MVVKHFIGPLLVILAMGFFVPQKALAKETGMTSMSISVAKPPKKPFKLRVINLMNRLKQSDKPQHKVALSALTIGLGVFGVHRLYLGTEPHVPILYAATLGGGLGIVPLIDLIHILAAKDPMVYADNDRFFMWGGQED